MIYLEVSWNVKRRLSWPVFWICSPSPQRAGCASLSRTHTPGASRPGSLFHSVSPTSGRTLRCSSRRVGNKGSSFLVSGLWCLTQSKKVPGSNLQCYGYLKASLSKMPNPDLLLHDVHPKNTNKLEFALDESDQMIKKIIIINGNKII